MCKKGRYSDLVARWTHGAAVLPSGLAPPRGISAAGNRLRRRGANRHGPRMGGPMPEQLTDDERVYARRWWTLGVLCLSLVMVIVGNTVLNVALPTLVRELDATSTQLQWIIDIYSLVFAGLLLTGGALGDRFGRKGALSIGLRDVRRRIEPGGHGRLRRPAHRRPGDHGHRRRPGDAGHPVDSHHRLPAAGAGPGHRRVGRAGRRRGRHRAGGGRLAARELLVGLGLPREPAPDRHRPRRRALPRAHVA